MYWSRSQAIFYWRRSCSRRDESFADAWNFGPWDDDAWPVERIATTMAQRWGGGATWFRDGHQSVHEAGLLKLDSSKARAELGWQPRLRLDIALDWLVDWYQAWQGGTDMQSFTLKQIASYAQAGGHSLLADANKASAVSSHSMQSFSENATSK